MKPQGGSLKSWPVRIPVGRRHLLGDLAWPADPHGLVVFAHGSGSSRRSPRNQHVASVLGDHGYATLLLDLLTEEEERADRRTAHLRFDIGLLADRLVAIIDWIRAQPDTHTIPIGLFGASTGSGAALLAAAARPAEVSAVVSRGGRPDLAGSALPHATMPTLLIVGGRDAQVIDLNRAAMVRMPGEVVLEVVPGATHLFEEEGTLERVAALAADWFRRYLEPAYERRLDDVALPPQDD